MPENQTICVKVDPKSLDVAVVQKAAAILRNGGLVAFPTETVYGLGANALDPQAVAKIFGAKGRPSDNPLIIHISNIEQVLDLAEDITVPAQRVMEAFWPGPLTVVLTKRPEISNETTAGLNTIAVRMPNNAIALKLIETAGVPVAAPSANTSGKPSPTTARHVLDDLQGKIDLILDGGACNVGLESTVLDLTVEPPVILRPGSITREDIEGVLGHVEIDPFEENGLDVPKAPGMKYKHYAPKAEVVVVTGGDYDSIFETVSTVIREKRLLNKRVGVLASTETARGYCADYVFPVGSRTSLKTVAQNLFYGLRFLDEEKVDIIIAEGYPCTGIGAAIMNRLFKAAGNQIIDVSGGTHIGR